MNTKLTKYSLLALTFLVFTGCSQKDANIKQTLIPISKKIERKIIKKDSIFEVQRKKKLSELIQKPVVPMKTPDFIVRVLSLPYSDDKNILHTQNFQFIKVSEGRWIIGEYLNGSSKSSNKLFTPLKK